MIRTALLAAGVLVAAMAHAEPAAAPSAALTPAQIKTLGGIVPSGGFAHFSGFGTDSCPMPAMYASGHRPWKITIVGKTALEYTGHAPSDAMPNPGPRLDGVEAAFRKTLETCGFPTPVPAGAPAAKGHRAMPRMNDAAAMKGMPGPATLAYLAGLGANYHNLPAVFAMRHADAPVLVVVGKDHPMKTFALPGGWGDAMTAYRALLGARGYK